MFSNLIESSSHGSEFRRRGSFLLFTSASYALLFVIAGVVSIYAYDARMEDQNLEIVTMMPLVELPIDQPPAPVPTSRPTSSTSSASNRNYFQREVAMADVDEPMIVPDDISTKANVHLPMPRNGIVRVGADSDPSPGNSEPGTGQSAPRSSTIVVPIETPPPPLVRAPVPKVVRKKIINGEAVSLPKPPYPEMAKQLKIQGVVNVQVLVDETGRVVSAKAVSGHAFLVREAQKAAFQARFAPTMFGDEPVKVSGVITYNFVLQL
ncbi:MAG: energy transducer TonB [Pyrinomonadaceae bacterium]